MVSAVFHGPFEAPTLPASAPRRTGNFQIHS
jgi:hypothetical protein